MELSTYQHRMKSKNWALRAVRAAKSPSAIKTFCFLTEDKWSAADDDTEDNLNDLNQALSVHEEEED